jgi:ribosome-associated toxin RatA of RatAB toxin-antitoxin module
MVATINPTDALPNALATTECLQLDNRNRSALLRGDILLKTRSHTAWGGAVTAQMYLPVVRSHVWQQVTDYPRWVQFFPNITHSEIIARPDSSRNHQRLYQVASKAFLMFSAQVEIYLKTFEIVHQTFQQIQFTLERGTFHDFGASLRVEDLENGTLLTYSVSATPTIPMPTQLIQQAIRLDLPTNMKTMRQVICA